LLLPRRQLDEAAPVRRVLFETDVGQFFNRRFSVERSIYRRHRIAGAVVLAGAVAAITVVGFLRNAKMTTLLVANLGLFGMRTVSGFVATIALILAVFGTCLLVRPSVLKGVEAAANKWIEPLAQSNSHMAVSRAVLRNPRLTAALLILGGMFCLVRPF
jgi:hypothetical protein